LDARIGEVNVNDVRGRPANVRVLEPARVAERPVKPKKAMVLGAGLLAGWVLGLGLALVGEWHEARLRSPREIVNVLGTPVVAAVPRISKRLSPVTRGQLVSLDVRSPVAEAYHSVRASLHLAATPKAKTILLASPMEGGRGMSTSASNLAIAFAQAGERTLIVDCDLREPVQHLIFEADGRVGLTNVVAGEVKLRDAVRATAVPNLFLLPCGPVPLNPSELLTGRRFDRVMRAGARERGGGGGGGGGSGFRPGDHRLVLTPPGWKVIRGECGCVRVFLGCFGRARGVRGGGRFLPLVRLFRVIKAAGRGWLPGGSGDAWAHFLRYGRQVELALCAVKGGSDPSGFRV
jgi:hypothetical protein